MRYPCIYTSDLTMCGLWKILEFSSRMQAHNLAVKRGLKQLHQADRLVPQIRCVRWKLNTLISDNLCPPWEHTGLATDKLSRTSCADVFRDTTEEL